MKFRRQILTTVLVQAFGGVATLLAALWIGKTLGPVQQGQFNHLKSMVDLGAALATMGMPQAIYVHVQSQYLSFRRAGQLVPMIAVLGIPVGLGLTWWQFGGVAYQWPVLMAGAVVFASLHQLWRVLILLDTHTWRFSMVTIAPQVLLMPVAAWVVVSGGADGIAVTGALMLAWLIASGLTWWIFRQVSPPVDKGEDRPRWRALFTHGGATWLTASMATLNIVILQSAAKEHGGETGLGQISLALLLAQLPITPLNYALPLLLRKRLTDSKRLRFATEPALWMSPMLLCALVVGVTGVWRSDLYLGVAYQGLADLLSWLLLAGGFEVGLRLIAVEAQADGQPWRSAAAEACRWVALMLGVALLPSGAALMTLAQIWAGASFIAWLVLCWLMRMRSHQ